MKHYTLSATIDGDTFPTGDTYATRAAAQKDADYHTGPGCSIEIEEHERPSALYTTTAPDAYDGFGTRSVGTVERFGATVRVVDVLDQHRTWQKGRNGSGFHSLEPLTDDERARVEWTDGHEAEHLAAA